MKDNSDEFNEPYLPARYKEVVRKKKQRRLLKKIGMIALAIVAVVVVSLMISGFFTGSPQPATSPTPSSTPAVTPLPTTVITTVPTTTAVQTVIATVSRSMLAAETVIPTTGTPEPILTARAGTIVTSKVDTSPKITEKQAEIIARAAFPNLPAGEMTAELSTSPDFGQVWKYTLRADTTTEASGLLDAETGTIVTFNRTIHPGGRPQNPVLTIGNARQIADSTLNSRNNGILSINMTDSRYIPLSTPSGNIAGIYRFVYSRVVQDYPCDADGFIISVDAVSGAITEFVQHWQTPDIAFMLAEDLIVPRYDATYAVQARAKSIYPSSISGLRIISADVRWKDRHDPATIPRPSTIPLAWKIVFDDEIIRAKADPTPSIGWVDAQNGELLEITYQH